MRDTEAQKELAGRWAAAQVADGMRVGLGTGSTAMYVVRALGERVKAGLRCTAVATSEATARLAQELGISLLGPDDLPDLDLAIDGADEVDPALDLIKGLGGALLREKLVELAARDLLIVVDESKLVQRLGEHAPLPVEVVPFAWRRTQAAVEALGCRAVLRGGEPAPFVTDGGHYLLDCRFGTIEDPAQLAARLKALPGVVEHGLFLGMATRVAIGTASGSVSVRQRGGRTHGTV